MNEQDLELEDVKELTNLSNEYIEKFINAIDPRKYKDKKDVFIQTSLTGPSIITASIIDKVSGTFHVDRKKVLKEFIKKLNLALRWVDHKNKIDKNNSDFH